MKHRRLLEPEISRGGGFEPLEPAGVVGLTDTKSC